MDNESKVVSLSTNASSSAFGWEFQKNAALVLLIRNIKTLDSVRVEGETEDIELYFEDGKIFYAQAKARTTSNPGDNSTKRFRSALHTLCADYDKEDCSQVIFVTNDSLPFGKSHKEIFYGDDSFLSFQELPNPQKTYILDLLVQGGYRTEITDIFSVFVFNFYGDDENTRYRVVRRYIDDFIGSLDCKLNRTHTISLQKTWLHLLKMNETNSDLTVTLRKCDIIWPLVAELCTANQDDYSLKQKYDEDIIEDTIDRYKEIINEATERFQFITKVIADYDWYARKDASPTQKERIEKFIALNGSSYFSDLGIEGLDDTEKEAVVQLIVQKILNKKTTIEKIKDEVNL